MVDDGRHTTDTNLDRTSDVDESASWNTQLGAAAAVDVQATFCAALVDQWVRLGIGHAVISPGSRSTPMALAIAARPELSVHVVHDERAAGFVALGLGLSTEPERPGTPALLLCTSGTAAANYLPAVAEAGLSEVPMLVLTADRPEELRGVGAPQTIDQLELYGSHVAWFCDPGVPDAAGADGWRQLAVDAWSRSSRGPVQLNLPFREPLVGTAADLPPEVESAAATDSPAAVDPVPDGMFDGDGVLLVGGMHGERIDLILELQQRTGWPLIADPQSGLRRAATVTTIDALLRHDRFATEMLPDTIVRIGRPSTSKVLAQWTARPSVQLVQVGGPGRIDPARNVAAVCSLDDLLAAAPGVAANDLARNWQAADELAEQALRVALDRETDLSEPLVARVVAEHTPPGAAVTVSSSMPVRDLEWFGGRAAHAHANRGANGIDGVMSTAVGRALLRGSDAAPSVVLIGDLAFVHDSNALVALRRRGVDMRIVVVDNGGGGIFSFLPQQQLLGHDRFEQLFGTPLGSDVLALAAAHGLATADITTSDELIDQLATPGPWVCRVTTDRSDNVEVHRRLHAAIVDALDEQWFTDG